MAFPSHMRRNSVTDCSIVNKGHVFEVTSSNILFTAIFIKIIDCSKRCYYYEQRAY
jgi:hypothetical protein